MKGGCRLRDADGPGAACLSRPISRPGDICGQSLEVAGVPRDEFVGLRLLRDQRVPIIIHVLDRRRCVPIRPHERLSRSSATALPMASGSSVYPVGTWKNSPPRRLTSLATTRLGPGFATTGTSLIVPSEFGSYAKTCPAFASGSRIRCRSSTVNVFMRGNSHQRRPDSSLFFASPFLVPGAAIDQLHGPAVKLGPFCGREPVRFGPNPARSLAAPRLLGIFVVPSVRHRHSSSQSRTGQPTVKPEAEGAAGLEPTSAPTTRPANPRQMLINRTLELIPFFGEKRF